MSLEEEQRIATSKVASVARKKASANVHDGPDCRRLKLAKVLITSAACECRTTSAAKRLVAANRVTVDGIVVSNPNMRLSPASVVTILADPHAANQQPVVIPPQLENVPGLVVYHKPCGVLTSLADDQGTSSQPGSCSQVSQGGQM